MTASKGARSECRRREHPETLLFLERTAHFYSPFSLFGVFSAPDAYPDFLFRLFGHHPFGGVDGESHGADRRPAGEGIGGLLNATFGNAAELIIAIVALRAGYLDIVKASLTGSIIGNILLVLGASFLAGGLRYKIQEYNAITARAQSQMLLLTSVAIIIPALFHSLRPPEIAVNEAAISLALAALLIVVYVFSLIFSLHPQGFISGAPAGGGGGGERGRRLELVGGPGGPGDCHFFLSPG